MNTRTKFIFNIILLSGLLLAITGTQVAAHPTAMMQTQLGSDETFHVFTEAEAEDVFSFTPVMFIENLGQFTEDARFLVCGDDHAIWLADDALWITILERPQENTLHLDPFDPTSFHRIDEEAETQRKGVNLKLSFVGANPYPVLEPFGRLDTVVSYFIGYDPEQWRSDVPVWSGVRYKDLYPGIDLEITGNGGPVIMQLVPQFGADLSVVRPQVDGAQLSRVNGNGLLLVTEIGLYQLQLFGEEKANSKYVEYIEDGNSFELAQLFAMSSKRFPYFDQQKQIRPQNKITNFNHELSIATNSPSNLLYGTFLGGSSEEHGFGIEIDDLGNTYITGWTHSTDFPTTPGAFDGTFNGPPDAFVVQMHPGGSLAYAAFLGGSSWDYGWDIAVDGAGSAYVTGETYSSDFPTTPGAFDGTFNGSPDAFVVQVHPGGGSLAYGTFLGGSDVDFSYGIAVDGAGSAYVTGETYSSDFPITPGAFDGTFNGPPDAFVVQVHPGGGSLAYGTFLGGSDEDWGLGIAVDEAGSAYVTGVTESSDFPITPGAFDGAHNGDDAFVVKVHPGGGSLAYSTFLGGSDWEYGRAIAVDGAGSAYVTGETGSSNFPTTPGAFDGTFNGGGKDAFVVQVHPGGGSLAYGTFLGGSDADFSYDIAVDGAGSAYVTGGTISSDFPTTPGAFDGTFNGPPDAFVVQVHPGGGSLAYSTFLGGSSDIDHGWDIAVDGAGSAYVTGYTYSSDFPTTPGAFDGTFNGGSDAFVVKMAMGGGGGYSISGQVTDENSNPIAGVTISAASGSSTTGTNGNYTITGLITGTYTLTPSKPGYSFTPPARTVTVPPDAVGQDFVGTLISGGDKPIVVLVHGFQGLSKTDLSCTPFTGNTDIVDYSEIGNISEATQYWKPMIDWLEQDYDVWVAKLWTGKNQGTPPISYNASCLRSQISHVVAETGQSNITLIAHSMGGLVSRECISLNGCGDKVKRLITLGSPHAGLPAPGIAQILNISCAIHPGACDMSFNNMKNFFNSRNLNKKGIDYYFIGGDGSFGPLHWQQPLWYLLGAGLNDGLVGKYSAVGWVWDKTVFDPLGWAFFSPPQQYWTDEHHSTAYSFEGGIQVRNDYYHARATNPFETSHAYQCFTDLLAGNLYPATCTKANILQTPSVVADSAQFTQVLENNITSDQIISPTLQIDSSGETIFYISWYTGTLDLRLKAPNGQVIDPIYAANNPDEVAYGSGAAGPEAPPFASYSITNTLSGEWTFIVDASTLDAPETGFWAFGLLETDRTMDAGIDGYYYNGGETAVLTATLQNDGVGIAGVNVTAEIARSDRVTDTLTLIDQGEGLYAANYTLPNAPGYLNIAIVAIGNDNGTAFTRHTDLLAVIAPQDAQFTGSYSDQGNDDNGDGFYEYLDFAAEVDVANAGDYIVSALLLSEDGQLITNVAVDISLTAGTHAVVLPFDGDDIRAAKIVGPYIIANLQITEITSGIPSQIVDEAWTTGYYDWEDFGSSPLNIYLPIVIR